MYFFTTFLVRQFQNKKVCSTKEVPHKRDYTLETIILVIKTCLKFCYLICRLRIQIMKMKIVHLLKQVEGVRPTKHHVYNTKE